MSDAADQLNRQVGQKLRELRVESGMSLGKLAGEVGLDIQVLWECEQGARRVSASELWDFCGVFDVSPSAFFGEYDQA